MADITGKGIDWDAIHRRLAAVSGALERGSSLSRTEAEEILKGRARAMAVPLSVSGAAGKQLDILEFLLAGESYAVETAFVRETLALTEFTPLFGVPRFVLGITGVHGRIVSIIDLRHFFDLPAAGLSDLNRLIVVDAGGMEFGVAADAIIGTRSLPEEELQPPLPTMTGIRDEFLAGVTGERLALLDMGKILADRRIVVHQEVE